MNAAATIVVPMLSDLNSISLEELNERAALQTRVDRKYVLPRLQLESALLQLDANTLVLETGGVQSFGYESVYFDTPELTSYLSAAHKRRRRFKVRTRSYVDSAQCFLEVKTRGGRAYTVKERLEYDPEQRDLLTSEGREYTDSVLIETGVGDIRRLPLSPVLTTAYSRTTLFTPATAARATIDVGLTWTISGSAPRELRLPDLAIVETKSASTPSEIDRMLWRSGHRPAAISKYGIGLAALNPGLPSNKWSRTLRRYFREDTDKGRLSAA